MLEDPLLVRPLPRLMVEELDGLLLDEELLLGRTYSELELEGRVLLGEV